MIRLMRRRQAAAARGFTLIELMVALVVSSIVVLGIFAFSSIQRSTASIHQRNVKVQQALEGAMWTIGQDVRDAGLGWARLCTELRVWDADGTRLLNPGGGTGPATAVADPVTGEVYWVLRDGIQAHWDSDGINDLDGTANSSAHPSSAADSFDVFVAEGSYVGSPGVFELAIGLAAGDTTLTVETNDVLDADNTDHLDQVRQLFPPGTFVILTRSPPAGVPSRPEAQGQCILLQITGDVTAVAGSSPSQWIIPIGTGSEFNNLTGLLADNTSGGSSDFVAGTDDGPIGASVVPLGRARWSRYEIDYTYGTLPYLVRYDFIGWQAGDLTGMGAVAYPHCAANQCRGPGLHLPGETPEPAAVAIGPMIEDMQVAVGCDGYTVAGAAVPTTPIAAPDLSFEEVGPAAAPNANTPNFAVDENAFNDNRDRDEWLGNAEAEVWAPDCVHYGTADDFNADWVTREGSGSPPPAFRMSPQSIRITLTGSSEQEEEAGGLATDQVIAVEDRGVVQSPAGRKVRFTLTELFTPPNLRWRDPMVR